jgi:hypothetical protein
MSNLDLIQQEPEPHSLDVKLTTDIGNLDRFWVTIADHEIGTIEQTPEGWAWWMETLGTQQKFATICEVVLDLYRVYQEFTLRDFPGNASFDMPF